MNASVERTASTPDGSSSSTKTATASVLDSFAFTLLQMIPYYLRGIFTRNHFWTWIFDSLNSDGRVVKLTSRLRTKYKSEFIYLRGIGGKSLLVLNREGIRRILDNSPMIYADPELKTKGMSHFQPNALTISRGDEWQDRRRFNEAVLNSLQLSHEHRDAFLQIIKQEVELLLGEAISQIEWACFDRLFKRITLRIIFGASAADHSDLLEKLTKMMRESNRLFLLRTSKEFESFYAEIRQQIATSQADTLAAACSQAPQTEETKVENQIPHWMFAMSETLATNTLRALLLVVAHANVEERIRAGVAASRLDEARSVAGIYSLKYLEGSLQEAMRLWPTTPLLGRKSVRADDLGGNVVPEGTQVIILNTFNHRDAETFAAANSFAPEQWLENKADYRFNHLSNGTQVCAGKNLALFVGTAVLAELLRVRRYQVQRPVLDPSKPLPYSLNEFRVRLKILPLP
jgi:cytochrome P450